MRGGPAGTAGKGRENKKEGNPQKGEARTGPKLERRAGNLMVRLRLSTQSSRRKDILLRRKEPKSLLGGN